MKLKQAPWLLISILLLVAGTIATFSIVWKLNRDWEADRRWEDYRSELVAAGEPVTFAELEARRPEVPIDQNGSLIIESLAGKLQELQSEEVKHIPILDRDLRRMDTFEGISPESVEAMRTFLEKHDDLVTSLASLHANTDGRLTVMNYDYEGDNPFDFTLPSLAPWKYTGILFHLKTLAQSLDTDMEGAMHATITQFGVAATMRNEPNGIIRVVRLRVIQQALASIEFMLRTSELDSKQLDELSQLVSKRIADISPKEFMRAERIAMLTFYDSFADGKIDSTKIYGNEFIKRLGTISRRDIRRAQRLAASIWTKQIEVADDILKWLDEADRIDNVSNPLAAGLRSAILVGHIMPSATVIAQLTGRRLAELQCAHTAIAAERFRLDQGRFPESFDELLPGYIDVVPIDPFTGKPLLLGKNEIGITIYSVSQNLEDDGGDLKIRKGKYSPPDVGFRLVEPSNRGSIIASKETSDDSE